MSIAHVAGQQPRAKQRPGPVSDRGAIRPCKAALQPRRALLQVSADIAEPEDRTGQPQGIGGGMYLQPGHRRPQVAVFGLQPVEHGLDVPTRERRAARPLRPARGTRRRGGGRTSSSSPLAASCSSAELADRLQHPRSAARRPVPSSCTEQAACRPARAKPSRTIGSRSPSRRDRLGRLEGEAAGEDGQAAEEGLLLGVEQVVAPGDRVAHRLLAGRQVARPAGQQRQPLAPAGPAAPAARAPCSGRRPARSPAAARPGGGRSRRRPRAFAGVSAKSALTARARWTKRATAGSAARSATGGRRRSGSGSASGGTGNSCSPPRRSGARLVTSTFRPGRPPAARPATGAGGDAPARSCRAPAATPAWREERAPAAVERARPPTSRTPSAWAIAGSDQRRDRASGASGTKPTPSGEVVGQVGRHPQGQAGLADAAGAGQGQQADVIGAEQGRDGRSCSRPISGVGGQGNGAIPDRRSANAGTIWTGAWLVWSIGRGADTVTPDRGSWQGWDHDHHTAIVSARSQSTVDAVSIQRRFD